MKVTNGMSAPARVVLMLGMSVVIVGGLGLALKLAGDGYVWIAALPVAFVIGCMGALFPPGDASDLE